MPTLNAKTSAPASPVSALTWVGLSLALGPMLVRAAVNATTLPEWDLDPLMYPMASTALTPMGSMLCDGVSLLGAAMLLLGAGRIGIRPNVPTLLLALIGAIAVVLHGWVLGPSHGTLGNQRIGSAWLGAVFVAAALWHAAQDVRVRRIAAGVVLGFVVVLALLGSVQVLVTHAQTVADYRADPDRMLAAHGWSAQSPMAKSFVRRLMQPEATGWFGLSNVYATFAAAAAVAGVGLAWGALRATARDSVAVGGAVLLALAGAAGLWFAHSKGGAMAAAVGVAALVALHVLSRRSSPGFGRIAGALGLAAIVGPIVLILIRGAIGERIGELSLLFRSFYIEAASRIVMDHPLVGVGPDGFQRAFTAVKPALCPEEVSSPHGIVFDWTATLGVFGLAWLCLLVRWAWGAGVLAFGASDEREVKPWEPLDRTAIRVLLLIPAGATIAAAFIEAAMTTPDMALVRVGGLGLWCFAAWGIARAVSDGAASRIALAAGAIAAIAHAQIDVAASLTSSVGLWGAIVALAAAPAAVPGRTFGANRVLAGGAAIIAAVGLLVGITAGVTVREWERRLNLAAETVRPIAEFADRLRALQRPGASAVLGAETIDAVVRDLGAAVGHGVSATPTSVDAAMRELEERLLPQGAKGLEGAYEVEPSDRRPLREASRLHLRLAERAFGEENAERARGQWQRAVEVLRLTGPASGGASAPGSSDWHWLASVHEHAAGLTRDPAELRAAIETRLRIVPLDPYNLDNARRIFRDAQALGDGPLVREWAGCCLELDGYMRLDREVRGLSASEREEIAKVAK